MRTAPANRRHTLGGIALLVGTGLGVSFAMAKPWLIAKPATPAAVSPSANRSLNYGISQIVQSSNPSPTAAPRSSGSIREIVRLCEVENPRFDANRECHDVVDKKYSGRRCSFKLGPVTFKPMGSCRDCLIECN